MRQRIGKSHTPEVSRRFSVATSGCKAAKPTDGMPDRQPGSESVAGGQRWHLIFAQEPPGNNECRHQPAGENASGLQSIKRENLAQVLSVHVAGTPIENYVENFRADNAGQHDRNAEVPCVLSFNSLFLCMADANPEPNQDAECDENAVRGDSEVANVEESRKHSSSLLDAGRKKKSVV